MSSTATVTITYEVFCGKLTPDGLQYPYTYIEQAPASLCEPHSDDGPQPDPDAAGLYMTTLVEAHQDEILHSHAWKCVAYDKPAREILHNAIPYLSSNRGRMQPDFERSVIDIAQPICVSGGICDKKAMKMVNSFGMLAMPDQFEASKTWDKWGKKSGVKICGGCRLLAYCSKEC